MRESQWREEWPLPVRIMSRALRAVDSRFHVQPN
jgi:hypothetical protein